eukprot:gene9009-9182_t
MTQSKPRVAVTANAYDRKQIGYTLVYAKQLQKREYILEGTAELTNPSGTDAVNIQSLTIFLGTQQISPSCGALPAGELRLGPTQQTSCPFSAAFSSDPGANTLSGFVQTRGGRQQAEKSVPFSFAACSSTGSGGCTSRDVGSCVTVTDGSYIINKFQDATGTQLAGNITRSQLFAVNVVTASTLGPPRASGRRALAHHPAAACLPCVLCYNKLALAS